MQLRDCGFGLWKTGSAAEIKSNAMVKGNNKQKDVHNEVGINISRGT